jgi:hypothetical protein
MKILLIIGIISSKPLTQKLLNLLLAEITQSAADYMG